VLGAKSHLSISASGISARDNRPALKAGFVAFFHGGEESIHVEVGDDSHGLILVLDADAGKTGLRWRL
jgi:hypothetical protein